MQDREVARFGDLEDGSVSGRRTFENKQASSLKASADFILEMVWKSLRPMLPALLRATKQFSTIEATYANGKTRVPRRSSFGEGQARVIILTERASIVIQTMVTL